MTNAHQRRPTQVNAGPQHPTKANAGPRRRKKDVYVFFCNVHFIFHFLITTKPTKAHSSQQRPTQVNEGPQWPTTANEGQRRPTETKRGPNDASGVVWAIICFFSNVQSICYFFITSRSTCSGFFSNKPRSEPEPALGRPWALS